MPKAEECPQAGTGNMVNAHGFAQARAGIVELYGLQAHRESATVRVLDHQWAEDRGTP